MWKRIEVFQILGRIHKVRFYWEGNLREDLCGPGEIDKNSNDYETRSCMA